MELVFWIFVCHVKIIKYFKGGTLIICWALAAIYRTYIWRLQNVTDWPHPPSVSILTQVNHLKTTNLNLQIVVITKSTEITNNKTNLYKSQNSTQEMTSLWSLHPLPCFLCHFFDTPPFPREVTSFVNASLLGKCIHWTL